MLSEQVKFVNHDAWNCDSWPEIKYLGIFGLKIAMCLIFMKFGTQNKSNMLIMNVLIGINDLDLKLQICEIWSQTEMYSNFYETWHLEQIWSQNWNMLQVSWNLALRTFLNLF